jgi:hypothetical protein
VRGCLVELPTLKWSELRCGFWSHEEDHEVEETAQA